MARVCFHWCLLVLLLSPLPAHAQQPVTLSGIVSAADGRAPVAGAIVAAGSTRTTTDQNGRFSLSVSIGPLRLSITAAGFLEQQLDVTVTASTAPIEIALVKAPTVREETTVSADGGGSDAAPATIALAPAAVLAVAGAGDNIFRALQTLPGVSATDDFGSRLAVRGGGPDQNLTVMDGVEIHNPYRLFGLTSAFNPETIDRFEMTAGGFGPEYGDRLSSILVVDNRAGTTRDSVAGSATISLTDANVVFEGKLPGRANGSWLVTGRRTYYDLVADRITGNDLPSFGDVQASSTWTVRPGHQIGIFGLRSRERTDATFTDSGDRIFVGDESRNDLVSLTYEGTFGRHVTGRTTIAWYDYADALGVDGTVNDGARRSNGPGPEAEQSASIVFTRGLAVRDRSVRQAIEIQAGHGHVLSAGADLHLLRTNWGWTITGDRNDSVANGSSIIGGTGLPSLLASEHDTDRAAAWLVDRWRLRDRLTLEPGLRIDRSGLNDEVLASPRFSAAFQFTPQTRLRSAIGRFTQSPGYEKLLQSDYFVDLTSSAATSLLSQRAVHLIAGVEHAITSSTSVRVEAYSKQFDRLIVGRLESPTEAAARVARYDFPPAFATSVPTAPQITSVPTNGATGHAYGFDLYVERRQVARNDRLSGWASYTWGRANMDVYSVRRPFDYDRRHALSATSTVHVFTRMDVGTTVRVASGFPATLPVGLRVASKDAGDGSGRLVPSLDTLGLPIWTVNFGDVSNLARGRLPVYARLDLRVTFKPRNPAGRWQVYFEVWNLLNRKNVSQLQPTLDYDPSSDRPKISYATDTGLPALPSFGFRYRF